ncbi:MAG: ABC-F family ATP-binding cassette domain-containing protein [Planctomycetota bacterium]|nr:ABC-F family ATP-binding cassette domain-containing protein [Planctomycetota bacterium]
MSMIIAENVTKAFGSHEVIRNVSFRLSESSRIGLVGPNGGGKTTLLQIVAGRISPTDGKVHRRRQLRIGYLPQDPPAPRDRTIYDAMLDVFSDLRRMERQLNDLAGRMDRSGTSAGETDRTGLLKQYDQMQSRFEALGGYDYDKRIEKVLTGLAFGPEMWSRSLSKLSGGERTRAHLAGLLLRDPDLLMLDEPTNHLDLYSVEWLESWLQSFRGALIVVSHDRYFLDNITADTWEIDFGSLETYRGPYSRYLTQRDERYTERLRRWEAQQEYIAKTEDFIARNISGQRGKEARGRRTRLERFMREEAMTRPKEHRNINVSLSSGRRTGDKVFRASDLTVGYDAPLLEIESLDVERGRRVAILGGNGVGKTALLRTLLGELDPMGGSVRRGSNVKVGYLPQTHEKLNPTDTALQAVMSAETDCLPQRARSALGMVLLGGDESLKRIDELSGGQRSRVVLARLMVQNPNVLMLDEPTNHLDIPSTEIMQNVLQSFDGTVVFVSHDRYLVQAVATHIWAIDDGRVRCIPGGWEAFSAWREGLTVRNGEKTAHRAAGKTKQDRKTEYRRNRKKANLMQRLRRRCEQIESEIEIVEAELTGLNDEISAAGEAGDKDRVQRLCREYPDREARLEALWTEWERIGEELGSQDDQERMAR